MQDGAMKGRLEIALMDTIEKNIAKGVLLTADLQDDISYSLY